MFLAVLVNLILTIALITQVRELQQRVSSLPPDLARTRDVAMLRPLRVREILRQNCVECHSAGRLGVMVSMEPVEIQRTVERMQNDRVPISRQANWRASALLSWLLAARAVMTRRRSIDGAQDAA